MTLRKNTIDNSIGYINKDGHSHSEQAPHISREREIVNQTRERKVLPLINFYRRKKSSMKT